MNFQKSIKTLLFIVLACSIAGCCKKKAKDDDEPDDLPAETPESTDPPVEVPKATNNTYTLSSAGVQFDIPAGWKKKFINGWNVFQPDDRMATLGFVTYSRPYESTRRIGQINRILGYKQIRWGSRTRYKVGRGGAYDGQGGQGTCQFKNGSTNCMAKYATIETNKPVKLLIFYTLSLPTGETKHGNLARGSLESIRPFP
jgi:hypothetical protein